MESTLANGAGLNNETWGEFKKRLYYHNHGEGVRQHITAFPIFNVIERTRNYDVNVDQEDGREFTLKVKYGTTYYDNLNDLLDELDDDDEKLLYQNLHNYAATLSSKKSYENIKDFFLRQSDCVQLEILDDVFGARFDVFNFNYVENNISSHLTRESAKNFIKRKIDNHISDNYGYYPEYFIYVAAMPYNWELNSIIKGILNGKIVFKE